MTTQPENKCDRRIYDDGRTVCVLAGASTAIEAIVVRVREELNIPLDWHYVGGRASILTLAPADCDEEILRHLKMAMPVWLGPAVDELGVLQSSTGKDGG